MVMKRSCSLPDVILEWMNRENLRTSVPLIIQEIDMHKSVSETLKKGSGVQEGGGNDGSSKILT